jgi:hypothetical protein
MNTPMVLPAALLATAHPWKERTCIEKQQQQQQQQHSWVVWATEGVINPNQNSPRPNSAPVPNPSQTQLCTYGVEVSPPSPSTPLNCR